MQVAGLREPVPAAKVSHRQLRIGLPQEADDLGFREPLLHGPSLSLGGNLNRNATQNRGDVTDMP
jgi:hypothetical protein